MSVSSTIRSPLLRAALVGVATFGLLASTVEARPGKGGSVGSRGEKTYTAPPATTTAPNAAPMQKSMTQPGAAAATAGASATAAAASAAKPSMMRNLLLGGLMGAALASVFGTGALAGIMGFLLQALLIGGVIALAVMFFRNRFSKPATATAMPTRTPQPVQANLNRMGNIGGGAVPALVLNDADFGAFERLLGDIQGAYSRGDLKTVGDHTTPEMLSYFAGELDANKRQGVRNELGSVKLLQGDLSESWREAGSEFATVAMRYSLTDATINVVSNQVISGSRTAIQDVTEIWTFRRDPNTGPTAWELSAIQQTA
jgi:predicted lipid-binding transport protein (Tim44 family)